MLNELDGEIYVIVEVIAVEGQHGQLIVTRSTVDGTTLVLDLFENPSVCSNSFELIHKTGETSYIRPRNLRLIHRGAE